MNDLDLMIGLAWLAALVGMAALGSPVAVAALMNFRDQRWRIGLRTLLKTMTLVAITAAVGGMVVRMD